MNLACDIGAQLAQSFRDFVIFGSLFLQQNIHFRDYRFAVGVILEFIDFLSFPLCLLSRGTVRCNVKIYLQKLPTFNAIACLL